ncbi:MAG: phosphoribosylformylglycinamidine synthase I [Deltaproteobacteria bacterium]|nr:phosphoribosylformylglycinamidine synthase I [Deltaproteobacteria bacterium]
MNNKSIKAGITVFPGSNCDFDVFRVLKTVFGVNVSFIWHKDKLKDLNEYDFIVIPGGFSYGDYLRSGALAARSPIMELVKDYAVNGGIVLGICNGFQILLEAGLLGGAMLTNDSLKFECKDVYLKTLNTETPFTCAVKKDSVLKMPIAHHDGNYFATNDIIDCLNKNSGIIFKYCDEKGNASPYSNPNGSLYNIAGISNETNNVMGLMPHPERSSEKILGSGDGGYIFKSIIKYIKEK